MYKKITGVDEESCRDNMVAARKTFTEYMGTLHAVKGFDQDRKAANDIERAEIRK